MHLVHFAVSSSLDSFQLCHVLAMEVEVDVDLSLVILSDAFFESKLLSTVFGAWLFCSARLLLRIRNPYNVFAVKHV